MSEPRFAVGDRVIYKLTGNHGRVAAVRWDLVSWRYKVDFPPTTSIHGNYTWCGVTHLELDVLGELAEL